MRVRGEISSRKSLSTSTHLLGFLRRVGQKDVVYKPVPFPKGPREVMFYKSLFCSYFDDIPKEVIVMKELVPRYYGTHDIVDRDGEIRILSLRGVVELQVWGGVETTGRGRVGTTGQRLKWVYCSVVRFVAL